MRHLTAITKTTAAIPAAGMALTRRGPGGTRKVLRRPTNFLEKQDAGFHYPVTGEFATLPPVCGHTGGLLLNKQVPDAKSGHNTPAVHTREIDRLGFNRAWSGGAFKPAEERFMHEAVSLATQCQYIFQWRKSE